MKLSSIRSLDDLKPVLEDPELTSKETEYWVFSDISKDRWANLTVVTSERVGDEYPKTFGHYHPDGAPNETYFLVSGKGVLFLQKKDLSEVFLVKVRAGQEIVIPKEYGHSWSNIGDEPLVSYDDWRLGHTDSDYDKIKSQHGMAYYLLDENGKVRVVKNPNYDEVAQPIWLTVEEYRNKIS